MIPLDATEVTNRRVLLAAKGFHKARDRWRATLAEIQATCKHAHIVETPWRSNNWVSDDPAMRLCRVCRLMEDARGASEYYSRLNGPVIRVEREEFYKIRDELGV